MSSKVKRRQVLKKAMAGLLSLAMVATMITPASKTVYATVQQCQRQRPEGCRGAGKDAGRRSQGGSWRWLVPYWAFAILSPIKGALNPLPAAMTLRWPVLLRPASARALSARGSYSIAARILCES